MPLLCPHTNCSAYLEGRPLYFDGDHLSGHGNRLLYPAFLREVLGHSPVDVGQRSVARDR
jgi:hypothetical protein